MYSIDHPGVHMCTAPPEESDKHPEHEDCQQGSQRVVHGVVRHARIHVITGDPPSPGAPFTCSMFATVTRQSGASTTFSALHKQYVASLYRRMLRNSLNWNVRRDLWRTDAQRIRADFEHNRNVTNPRQLSALLQSAEAYLETYGHPDPYKREYMLTSPDVCRGNQVVRTAMLTRERNLPVCTTC